MGDFTQPQQNSDDGGKNPDIGAIKGGSLTNSYIYALLDFEYSILWEVRSEKRSLRREFRRTDVRLMPMCDSGMEPSSAL